MSAATPSRHGRLAGLCIVVIALLPLLSLLWPAAVPAGMPQRLIVLLPGGNDLAQASRYLDAAEARALGQGSWSGLWLVSTVEPDAPQRLYAAGARLVLNGSSLLAGCLGFRPVS